MLRSIFVIAILVCPVVAWTQTGAGKRQAPDRNSNPQGRGSSQGRSASQRNSQPYHPAVPAASTVNAYGGGFYGGGGASTAAGSAMNGMASVISAQGDYNLSTSAAAINLTQAQKQEIENRQQWTNTYFEMRATNRAAVAAERGPRLSMEQLARIAHESAPKPLNSRDLNPVSGSITWTGLLQEDQYAKEREELDELAAKQAYQGLNFSEQMKARQLIEAMFAKMKDQIKGVEPQQYAESKKFLRSLIYAMSKSDLG